MDSKPPLALSKSNPNSYIHQNKWGTYGLGQTQSPLLGSPPLPWKPPRPLYPPRPGVSKEEERISSRYEQSRGKASDERTKCSSITAQLPQNQPLMAGLHDSLTWALLIQSTLEIWKKLQDAHYSSNNALKICKVHFLQYPPQSENLSDKD